MPKKQAQEEFILKSKIIFGDKFDYSKVVYINSRTEVLIICKKHGEFTVKPNVHLCYKSACIYCSGRHNKQIFIEKSRKIHKNKYDYSQVEFVNVKIKVKIKCKKHGYFMQTPEKHAYAGQGCPKCKKSSRKDLKYFLNKSKIIHGDKYDYSKVNFQLMNSNVEIICKKHGSFFQTPTNHTINKQGCIKCHTESTRLSLEDFINKSNIAHHNKYDYSKVNYINSVTKVEIICKIHGSFFKQAKTHMSGGAPCSKCSKYKTSVKENLWLDLLKIPENFRGKRFKINNKKYWPDGYDFINNIIYEFYGDYWHGNPEKFNPNDINKNNKQTFGVLYNKTMLRKNELENIGLKVIYIWENDFDNFIKNNKTQTKMLI